LKAILNVWGIDCEKLKGTGNASIGERIKVQKLMHLLQNKLCKSDAFYGYNMYLYGPYSPTLSRDYYELVETKDIQAKPLKESARKAIAGIQTEANEFATEHSMTEVRALELLGTTLFFAKQYSRPEKVSEAVRTVKKAISRTQIKAAHQFLSEKDYLPQRVE